MKDQSYSMSKVVDADHETLFKVVSDFSRYKIWNTVIPDAKGELIVGTELQLAMVINGKKKPFNPKVLSIVPNKSFLLSKIIFSKRILELTHQFEFKELANHRTEFIQTWKVNGLLSIILWGKIKNGFSIFEVFNDNLVKHINNQKNENQKKTRR